MKSTSTSKFPDSGAFTMSITPSSSSAKPLAEPMPAASTVILRVVTVLSAVTVALVATERLSMPASRVAPGAIPEAIGQPSVLRAFGSSSLGAAL